MDNLDAIKQIAHLMKTDVWDKLSVRDRHAIKKAQMALENVYHGDWKHEIDTGMPIRYFTKGKIESKKSPFDDGFYVMVDGRIVFSAITSGEHCRGLRGEMVIYDNSVDKKEVDEILAPLLRGNVMLVHDAFDLEELKEEAREYDEILREHD